MNKYLSASWNSVVSLDLENSWAARSLQDALKNPKYDARFQQRQMQEKEEKLLKLYENQQQRAFDRVGRGSAGSNGSLTNISTGKVRQMFDERRQKAGIDRSYPLEPLSKTMATKTNRTTSLDRQGQNVAKATTVQRTTRTINGYVKSTTMNTSKKSTLTTAGLYNNNSKVFDEAENYLHEHENLVRMMNKNNLDDNLDDEEMPRIGFDDLGYDEEIFAGKLANVGGKLPSQTVASASSKKVPTTTINGRSVNGAAKPPLRKPLGGPRPVAKPASPAVIKPSSPTTSLTPTRTTTSSKNNNTRSESSSSGNSSKESTPAGSPAKMAQTRSHAKTAQGDVRAPSAARSSTRPVNRPQSVQRDDLTSCRYCQRRFATDRIQTHEDICSRTAKKKRKTYDSTKHRLSGTEAEPLVKKSLKTNKAQSKPNSKTNWRQKHEEFIAAIRAAKEAQVHIAKGGNIRDLPPPPPSSNPDYVQCPHCGRRFNESAAARHIPKCASYQFNKPNPKSRK